MMTLVDAPSDPHTEPDADPAVAHRRDRVRRTPIPTTVVVVEVLLFVGLVVWAASGSRWGWVALAIVAVVCLTVVPWRDGISPMSRLGRRISFTWTRARRRSTDLIPAPFDIPPARQTAAGAGCAPDAETPIGARWVGHTLITAIRVHPCGPDTTFLTPDSATPRDPWGQQIPLEVLAECIDPYDIPLASIDIVGHGGRAWGADRAAAAYRATLGPLPATALRTTLVILRLDPRDCPDAIARRGGGAVGALRAATITTRRVIARLAEQGLAVSALSAAEISSVTDQLTGGCSPDEVTEAWNGVSSMRLHMCVAAVEPTTLVEVATRVWAMPAAATTLTIRLSRNAAGGLRVAGLVRLDDHRGGPDLPRAHRHRGLRPLPGNQFDAFTAGVPMASSSRLHRLLPALEGADAQAALSRMQIPAAGCGQLVGADRSGRAVAVPLAGPGIGTVAVSGDRTLLAQTVLRTVATGIPVIVRAADPLRWRGLVEAVAAPHLLTFADHRVSAGSGLRVEVFDGVNTPACAPDPGCTRFVVMADADVAAAARADVALIQNPTAPQRVSVLTGRHRTEVTMVATAAEQALYAGGH